MFNDFYRNKRVLVTGHTGFKGGWLSLWLHHLGAEVVGLGLPAPTQPSFYEIIRGVFAEEVDCDIRAADKVAAAVKRVRPDVVFHLAAQPIVRRSYAEPLETLNVNVIGTAHILEAVRMAELPCTVLAVTSDKCYENKEWEFAYRENDPLGGHDVYSMSKAATELVAQSWHRSFFAPNPRLGSVVTARSGNVIGGGDYAPDRIVPDCIRALMAGKPIQVRNPNAVRPWQHVLECLSGYLWLAARVAAKPENSRLVGAFNFGPDPSSRQPVRRVVEEVLRHWPGEWVDAAAPGAAHEATLLMLAIDKAAALLGWRPVWSLDRAVQETIRWYRQRHQENRDMLPVSREQIDAYVTDARRAGAAWA